MAKTNVSLANLALMKLGKKPSISDLENGTTNEERLFKELLPTTKRNCIRKYRPNCCVNRALLSQDPSYTPAWGFSSGYKYPATMVKLLEVDESKWYPDSFPIEGKWILSHNAKPAEAGQSAPALKIKYLQDKPISEIDDDFFDIIALELAVLAAPVIDQTREQMIIALRNSEVDRWAADNAMENGFTVEEYDPLFGTITEIRS